MAVSPILSSAVTGLLSSGNKVAKAAQDIVEAGTTDLQDGGAGTITGTQPVNASSADTQLADRNPDAKLTGGLVDLIQAEAAYKANAAVIRTEDELGRRLLDTQA